MYYIYNIYIIKLCPLFIHLYRYALRNCHLSSVIDCHEKAIACLLQEHQIDGKD